MHRSSNWKFTANCCIAHWNANETRLDSANAIAVADCSDFCVCLSIFLLLLLLAIVICANQQIRQDTTRSNNIKSSHKNHKRRFGQLAICVTWSETKSASEKMYKRAVRYATESKEFTACVGVHVSASVCACVRVYVFLKRQHCARCDTLTRFPFGAVSKASLRQQQQRKMCHKNAVRQATMPGWQRQRQRWL